MFIFVLYTNAKWPEIVYHYFQINKYHIWILNACAWVKYMNRSRAMIFNSYADGHSTDIVLKSVTTQKIAMDKCISMLK